MLKQFLVFSLLTQRNLISSESEVNEKTDNARSTRQLNFGECCPCPGQDAFQEQRSASNRLDATPVGDDSCPCRSTSDSESASSVFRPAFRAIEPYIRPVSKKEEPKPLLNPEVGLASSVLETLREVTDQEYQEALDRDAARSTLEFMDPELPETDPRNEVNIIVSPKDHNNEDIMSEATETQGSTCVRPLLHTTNNFDHLRQQPSTNFQKHNVLTPLTSSSNGISNRNSFDMDGSISSTQDRTEPPLKNSFLENMKTRFDSLKIPFPSTDNRDFLTSSNILQKYNLKNNIKDNLVISRNKPLLDAKSTSPNNLKELFVENATGHKELDMKPEEEPDFKKDASVSFGNNARKFKMTVENNILQNTDCKETLSEPNTSLRENSEDFDVVPSSSKIIEVKNLNTIENPNIQENETDKVLDMDTDTNNLSPSTLESITKEDTFHNNDEEASEIITEDSKFVDIQDNDFETENTTENLESMKDIESEPSNRSTITNLQDAISTDYISSNEEENKIRNTYPTSLKDLRGQDRLFLTSAEKDTVDSKINTLPNIKADIFRTFESFKKASEKVQEKLRSNVQEALQLVITNGPIYSPPQKVIEPQSELRASSVEQPQNNANTVTNTSDEKSMSTQDLQKMSDSLLELSSLKDNTENSKTSRIKEELVKELENKPLEIKKVPYIGDMITSPTSLNEKIDVINLKNGENNLNVQKTEGNLCCNNMIPNNPESIIAKNDDNEMTAQPTNSVFNSISQQDMNPSKLGLLQRDFIVQPEDNTRALEGIKDFLNSFSALEADRSTSDDRESVDFNNNNQPLFRSPNDRNIESPKSFSRGNTQKFDLNSNLGSYKAKIASPKSLHLNSFLPTLPYTDDEADVLGYASQKMPHTSNLNNAFRNNLENGLNPLFKTIQTPKMLQDTFSSITPRVSESFKSHTNNALKTFRDSLDVGRHQPFTIYKDNSLGKPLINPDHLIGAFLKTHEDFNDKIQAFHSDINRRLSSISSRTSPEDSRLLWTPNRLKNSNNRAELFDISSKNTKSPTMKNTLLSKNVPSIEYNKKKSANSLAPRSNKADILRSNIKEKLRILPHQKDLISKKGNVAINPPKSFLTSKQSPKSNMKLKPLKESKVTISFATTSIRPDTLKTKFKPSLQIESLRSKSAGGLAKLPKLTNSLEDKNKQILKSKLTSAEPKVLASEISMSRAALPETVGKSEISQEVSLEESERSHEGNNDYDERRSAGILEANKRNTLLLSKLRRPFATGVTSDGAKRNDKVLSSRARQKENVLDVTESASNNIDTSISATSLVEKTSKDKNQSFKCKLVCIQDILDSTDTLNL